MSLVSRGYGQLPEGMHMAETGPNLAFIQDMHQKSTNTKQASLLLSLLVLWIGGCAYEQALVDELHCRIINGSPDPGHEAVGLLHIEGYPGCTATLVGSRTVITAAHCVTTGWSMLKPIAFSLTPSSTVYASASVSAHPEFMSNNVDIAVVRLQQVVAGVAPVPIATAPPTMGEQVTLVGYGVSSENADSTFGVKRKAQNTIGKITPGEIVFYGTSGSNGNICGGDSGGPAFAVRNGVEVQIGVHSWGEQSCGVAEHDTRVEAYRQWIETQAQGDLVDATKDEQPPQVAIESPANNALLDPSFTVVVNATDDRGIDRVGIVLDGKMLDYAAQPPFTFQVQDLPGGPHTLVAEAVDLAGNQGAALINITVRHDIDPVRGWALPSASDEGSSQNSGSGSTGSSGDRPGDEAGGCSMAQQGAGGSWAWLVLGLLCLVLGWRREGR
jgi:hypothetical protein